VATVRAVAVVPGHRSAGQLLEVATPDAFGPASKPRNDQPRVLQDMIDTGYRHDKRLEHQTVHQTQGIGVALATDEPAPFMPETHHRVHEAS
jgi:hypothetical protein